MYTNKLSRIRVGVVLIYQLSYTAALNYSAQRARLPSLPPPCSGSLPHNPSLGWLGPNRLLHLWHHPHHTDTLTLQKWEAEVTLSQRLGERICNLPHAFHRR